MSRWRGACRHFAQAGGPIVIGHHCELTGGFASWGYWHDKCAQAATKLINEGGGIAGRKVELVTEDTESNPAAGARKLRSLIQRSGAAFVTGSVHSGVMLASIPVVTELKTIYFSTGEATEATGEKGTRYSFRTGTDTYGLAAAGAPWAFENLGKRWTIISPDYAWGHSHYKEHKAIIEQPRRQGSRRHLRAARCQGSRSLSGQDSAGHRSSVLRSSSERCRSRSTPRRNRWASKRR